MSEIQSDYTLPVVAEKRIPVKHNRETFTLWGFFDVHLDNNGCDIDMFKRDMQSVIDDPNAYAIFGGDTLDMMFAKFDKRLYPKMLVPRLRDTDNPADLAVEYLVETIRPLVDTGRVIGMMEGNHEASFADKCGTHVIKRACQLLGLPFLGYECYVDLYFDRQSEGMQKSSVVRSTGYLHHGFGGSSPVTGGAIQLSRINTAVEGVQFSMMGHIHKQTFAQSYKQRVVGEYGNRRVEAYGVAMAVCGAYLRRSLWNVTKGCQYAAIGCGRIYFDVYRTPNSDGRRPVVNARVN